ncbi:MAG: AtpZ/AtpI family protein [Phycisphaerae bacterium]|nr:AtpZ/AtpI family protein [Phycisphaerae bacterium]
MAHDTRPPSQRKPTAADYSRYAGMGIEFAAAIALCVAAGWWVDKRCGTMPWFILVGLALGFAAGLYRLVLALGPGRGGKK